MIISGIGVSPGIVVGRARVIKSKILAVTGVALTDTAQIAAEIEKFENAVARSITEVQAIITSYDAAAGTEALEILETHIELLGDPQIKEDVTNKITSERKNASDALTEVIGSAVGLFKSMDDQYFSARASDVQDIGNRIFNNLAFGENDVQNYPFGTIIIAEDLTPSDTITMDVSRILGFATRSGGTTSHAAIIARSRGIPAVTGCGALLEMVQDNDEVILDGLTGSVIVRPDKDTIDQYETKIQAWRMQADQLKLLTDTPAVTSDGTAIKLLANIAGAGEMEQAIEFGAGGAGLFRTEFLFLGRDSFPAEEEQFEYYKAVAISAKGKPVTVRTLDIGGDKQLPYFKFPEEQNPFLGYRAIRFCLDRKDIFLTQLRAILRASAFGKLKIMFPMISAAGEIRAAKEVLEQAKGELLNDNTPFDKAIPVGIMIEIPSAAITADQLARYVDFFSIGTNDLCQYTLAVDRMNEKIKDLYDPFNPGVLRLIKYVIEQADARGIEVTMCGEMASDPRATLLLLGMGLREFSMGAASIPQVKNLILHHQIAEAKQVCEQAMKMDDSASILNYLEKINQ